MDAIPSTSRNYQPQAVTNSSRSLVNVIEDEVDQQLWKLDGKIQRKKDEKL